jgi:hypothetical protein
MVRINFINRITAGTLNNAPLELRTVFAESFNTSTLPLACRQIARFQ